jgi:hypothetical protein
MGKVYLAPDGLATMQAKLGIVVAVLFLLFGMAFGVVVGRETPDPEGGLKLLQEAVLLFWVVAGISLIVFYARLLSKKGASAEFPGRSSL